jgi:hypothetical protein
MRWNVEQPALFHESFGEALADCVRALGGNKTVGVLLWPEKSIDDARRALLDALNPDRAAKLSPEQVLLILAESRKIGCHVGAAYVMQHCGYADPQPIEPADEKAALQREFVAMGKSLKTLFARMERAGMGTP